MVRRLPTLATMPLPSRRCRANSRQVPGDGAVVPATGTGACTFTREDDGRCSHPDGGWQLLATGDDDVDNCPLEAL